MEITIVVRDNNCLEFLLFRYITVVNAVLSTTLIIENKTMRRVTVKRNHILDSYIVKTVNSS